MKEKVLFKIESSEFSNSDISFIAEKLGRYIWELNKVVEEDDWSHPAASLLLPLEKKYFKHCLSMTRRIPKPALVIVVGIGGSNLGASAVSEAILGKYHNISGRRPQILFAENVDPSSLDSIIKIAKIHLKKRRHIAINLVSKSGKTLETMANFDILYSKLKKLGKKKVHVIATGNEFSEFEKTASRQGINFLQIPHSVGGRYSIFSNAGLFPLALAKINIPALLSGAKLALKHSLSSNISKNPAALMASFLFLHQKAGRKMHFNFMFSDNLHALGLWHRQLLAESVGKKGKGITPDVAIGTTDLHSMAQLFLGGPEDKTFRFVSIENFGKDFTVSSNGIAPRLVPEARERKISKLMHSVCNGVKKTFKMHSIPFASFELPSLNEESIGYLMQMEMMETMFLAKLMGVNAFNQPEVEKYKKEAKKLLEKK
ncbi:MAG: hypothetical protein ABIH83_02915 [Candidatus Micrarchaeota archaeon]